ncbi:hypothetical protein [uncultured Roseibium sp.]|uniref:hypothetical protein n=1 Tax=uncultured Roseibium sp. TaxID=1936171 RepID=UPI00321620CF
MSENPDASLPNTVPISVLAEILETTDRQARNRLADAGVKSAARGRWPFATSVRALLHHAQQERSETEYSRAKARAINAQARKMELATAKSERELVPVEDATAAGDAICAAVRSEMAGLPARVTRDIPLRRVIEAEINASLHRIAATLREQAQKLRKGIDDDE